MMKYLARIKAKSKENINKYKNIEKLKEFSNCATFLFVITTMHSLLLTKYLFFVEFPINR